MIRRAPAEHELLQEQGAPERSSRRRISAGVQATGRQRWSDLGRASSASGRRADCAPPFPPDAERHAFTAELSISPCAGGPPAKRSTQTPFAAQRSFHFGKTNYSPPHSRKSRSGVSTPHEADPGPSRSETKGRHPIRLRRASSLPGNGLGTFTAGHPHEAALLLTTKCRTVLSRQAARRIGANVRYRAFCLGLATLVLAGCNYNRTPNFAVEAPRFRIPPDYRQKIVAWTKRYYIEPNSVRILALSDPMPVLVTSGIPVWLVCVELDARERGGPYMGPRRIALGFYPDSLGAYGAQDRRPQERGL